MSRASMESSRLRAPRSSRTPTRLPMPTRLPSGSYERSDRSASIINEAHLERVLRSYADHYNGYRPHQGLSQEIPAAEITVLPVGEQNSDDGRRRNRHRRTIRRHDRLGGLIH